HRHGHGVLVVFADVDHGQLKDAGEIYRFVKRALGQRTIAKKAHDDPAQAHLFAGQGGPCGDGDSAAHDAVGAEIAGVYVGDVHGTAAAEAVAGFLASELRHHKGDGGAFVDGVAVAPVGAGDVVAVLQGFGGPHGRGLLADVQMKGAPDVARLKEQVHLLLEVP